MLSRCIQPISLFALATLLAGCWFGGPSRVHPPGIDADAAGPAAIQEYDTNGDQAIAGDELAKAGSIRQAFMKIDGAVEGSSPDQKITADEITARINKWKESRVGRMATQCTVRWRGQPLAGAEVRFVPEKFLGEDIQAAVGTTDQNGTAVLSIPDVKPPGVAPGLYKVEISKKGPGGQETGSCTIQYADRSRPGSGKTTRWEWKPALCSTSSNSRCAISTNYSRRWRRVRFARDSAWERRNVPIWKHAHCRSFSNMAGSLFWTVWPRRSRKTTDARLRCVATRSSSLSTRRPRVAAVAWPSGTALRPARSWNRTR